ncbi:T9SS type A sorting domain-containing protein [Aureispira]|nr:T9SS type A sorting domain-containing protein [Aureispira sp.]
MKNLYLTLLFSSLGLTALKSQDLYIKFNSQSSINYGLSTVDYINFSVTHMNVHLWGGNIQSYRMDSIDYYNFQPSTIGINTIEKKEDLLIYPNPSNGLIYLSYHLTKPTRTNILIYNISGQLIWSRSKGQTKGELTETLNLNEIGINPGVYFVELRTKSKRLLNKLILTQ